MTTIQSLSAAEFFNNKYQGAFFRRLPVFSVKTVDNPVFFVTINMYITYKELIPMFKKAYNGAEIKFVMFDNDELVLSASVTEGTEPVSHSVSQDEDDTPIVPAIL